MLDSAIPLVSDTWRYPACVGPATNSRLGAERVGCFGAQVGRVLKLLHQKVSRLLTAAVPTENDPCRSCKLAWWSWYCAVLCSP